jgi:hypothetical protein
MLTMAKTFRALAPLSRAAIWLLVALGLGCSRLSAAGTSDWQGSPAFLQGWSSWQHVFLGSVDSAQAVRYTPAGPCAGGLEPHEVGELSVTVTEVLSGLGLQPHERVRTFDVPRVLHLTPGDRVLVGSNRTCADDWSLWGSMWLVDSSGALGPVTRNGGATRAWREARANSSALGQVRDALQGTLNPGALLGDFSALDLAVVTSAAIGGPNTATFHVAPVLHLCGPTFKGPMSVALDAPADFGCETIGVGDTLLIPRMHTGDLPTLRSCADYLLVSHGMLPALGIPLAELPARIMRTKHGFGLAALLQ